MLLKPHQRGGRLWHYTDFLSSLSNKVDGFKGQDKVDVRLTSLDVSMLSKEICHQMYTATNTLIRVTTNSVKTMVYLCYNNHSKEQNITSYGPLTYHDQKVHTVFRHSTLRPQGRRNRSGWSGFGRTNICEKKGACQVVD